MKLYPKNLCKKLSVVNRIGVCRLKNCVCSCWMCDHKDKCGKDVFNNCQLKSEDFKEISDAHIFYDNAIRKISNKIQLMMETEDNTKIMGGLLFHREREILHCFYEAPGDLPSAISTANTYINQDISIMNCNDIKPNPIATEIWNLNISKEVCSIHKNRLGNGDLIYYANKQGTEELKELVNHPEYFIEKMNESIKKNIFPSIESLNYRQVYSTKMLDVMQWCLQNIHQVNMMDYTLNQNFNDIVEHMSDVGKSGEISPIVCYRLAYPHYSGLIHVCRYAYSKFAHIKQVSQKNKDISEIIKSKFNIDFNVKKNYDNFLMTLWSISKSGKFCMDEILGKDTKNYKFIIQDGSLFSSVLLLGFISKNYDVICLKPYERGRIFEDFVEQELVNRQVRILQKHFNTPNGEFDFLCSKNEKVFFIEAKDYGPWFDDHYISSKTYLERMNTLNDKLMKAPPRLQWVRLNCGMFGLSPYQRIKGIVLTKYFEPNLRIPPKFDYITIENMNRLFGKSKRLKIDETKIKFRIDEKEPSVLEKEFLEKREKEYLKYGLR